MQTTVKTRTVAGTSIALVDHGEPTYEDDAPRYVVTAARVELSTSDSLDAALRAFHSDATTARVESWAR
jgi:hypothetical protein